MRGFEVDIEAGAYVVLLLGASLASLELVLDLGEPKYFCEIDCHIAYSVEYVTTTKALRSVCLSRHTDP